MPRAAAVTEAPAEPATAAGANGPPRIVLCGPLPAGGAPLAAALGRGDWRLTQAERLPDAAEAALLAVSAAPLSAADIEERGNELAEDLRRRGRRLAAGGLPVFLVLVGAEKLARPGDDLAGWLERVEAAKAEADARFRTILRRGDPRFEQGFGSIRLHVWAVALERPAFAQTADGAVPFGVAELKRQLGDEARSYQERAGRQGRRETLTCVFLGLVCLALLAGSAVTALGVFFRGQHSAMPLAAPVVPREPALERADAVLASLRGLLRFEEHRAAADGAIDWPAWHAQVSRTLAAYARLEPELKKQEAAAALRQELARAAEGVTIVRDRAAALGLPGAPPDRPPLLAFRPDFLKADAAARLDALRAELTPRLKELAEKYPNLTDQQLPEALPSGVVRALEAAAAYSHEALLTPARDEIRGQVRALGDGRETYAAWQKLARGWLANQAAAELAELRALSRILQQLAGAAAAHDPVAQLRTFLDQGAFVIPLDPVVVEMPPRVGRGDEAISGLRPTGDPLEITLRDGAGQSTELQLVLVPPSALRPATRGYVYAATRDSPLARQGGRQKVGPDEVIAVRLKAIDDQKRAWQLVWTPADPSRSFRFLVLAEFPECIESAGGKRIFGHGIQLKLPDPAALRRPDLLPR
jgi:hypothetical protein